MTSGARYAGVPTRDPGADWNFSCWGPGQQERGAAAATGPGGQAAAQHTNRHRGVSVQSGDGHGPGYLAVILVFAEEHFRRRVKRGADFGDGR